MDRQRHELLRQLAQPLHQEIVAGFHHHAQPQREALRLKRFVAARPIGAPQIVVEHALELGRGRQRDQLARVFEPDPIDQLPEHCPRQLANGGDQPGAFENAQEQLRRRRNVGAAERCHRGAILDTFRNTSYLLIFLGN